MSLAGGRGVPRASFTRLLVLKRKQEGASLEQVSCFKLCSGAGKPWGWWLQAGCRRALVSPIAAKPSQKLVFLPALSAGLRGPEAAEF